MRTRRYLLTMASGIMVAALCCAVLWNGIGYGQEKKYPAKPIELINHMAAGGPTDVWGRIVINELTKELGVPIQVQYRPGGGGIIGASVVATAKADGYTLLVGTISSLISAPFLESEAAPYDVLKDFTPIASCIVAPNVLVTHTSTNLTSFDTMIKLAKEKAGALNCATPGAGTTAHLILEVLKMHGVTITPVPTKGGAPAVTAAVGKHVDMAAVMYTAAVPHIKSGAIRILAATDKLAQDPSIPTLAEKGYPDAAGLGSLQGFLAPANLPKPIQDQLSNATRKVLQVPSVKKALEDAGFTVVYLGPADLKKKMETDYASIDKIARAAKLGKYGK
jgi:tripartite-type tricarboxylate transporter receptor subunit TctC